MQHLDSKAQVVEEVTGFKLRAHTLHETDDVIVDFSRKVDNRERRWLVWLSVHLMLARVERRFVECGVQVLQESLVFGVWVLVLVLILSHGSRVESRKNATRRILAACGSELNHKVNGAELWLRRRGA